MAIGANSITENFNSLTLGDINGQGSYAHASAWSTTGTSGDCWCRNYDSLDSYHLCMRDYSNTLKAVCSLSLDSGYQSVKGYIQFRYYHPIASKTSYVGLQSSSSEDDWICGVGLNYTNYLRGNVGSGWFDIQGYAANTYYTVKIEFNTTAKTAKFYVDGVLKTTRTLTGSTSPVTHIYFRTTNSGSSTYAHFDDLVFSGEAQADPPSSHTGSSSVTATSSVSSSVIAALSGSSSVTATTSLGSSGAGASTETDNQYFFGSYNGKVYAEDDGYKSDGGQEISSFWLSKQTDFADEDMECLGKFKTVYGAQLWYKDIETDVPVTVGVSNDGGVTWETQTKTLGTNNKKEKTAIYDFIVTGNTLQFKIQNDSDNKIFQWTALKALYTIGGDYFEVD